MEEIAEYKTIRCEQLQLVSENRESVAFIQAANDQCTIALHRNDNYTLSLAVKDDLAIVAIFKKLPDVEFCLSVNEGGQIQLAPTERLHEILQSPNVVEVLESMLDDELPEKVEEIVTTLHEKSRGL